MPDLHGTRRTYKAGCHCRECRAANATWFAEYRRDKAHGKLRLGCCVSAIEARRRLKQLEAEGVKVAALLGLKHPSVRLQTERVTVKQLLRIRALWRRYLYEPTEAANR